MPTTRARARGSVVSKDLGQRVATSHRSRERPRQDALAFCRRSRPSSVAGDDGAGARGDVACGMEWGGERLWRRVHGVRTQAMIENISGSNTQTLYIYAEHT